MDLKCGMPTDTCTACLCERACESFMFCCLCANNGDHKREEVTTLTVTREQLNLPLASPPSPSGIRGIRWVAQSIDLWLVSRGHLMTPLKYSDRHLAGLFAGPPDRVELIGAGSLGYGTGPSFG